MRIFIVIALFLSFIFVAEAQSIKNISRESKQESSSKKWGYENKANKYLWWDEVSRVKAGFLSTNRRETMTNLGYDTDWAISPQYEQVSRFFSENLAGVQLNGKVGFIDAMNRFIIKPKFEPDKELHGFSHGLAAVKMNGKYGFIDKSGQYVITPVYEYADNFRDNYLATVKMDGKFGAINLKGELVVPCKYMLEEAMITVPISNKVYKQAELKVKMDKDNGVYDEILSKVGTVEKKVNDLIRDSSYIPPYEGELKLKKENDRVGIADKDGAWILPSNYKELISLGDYYMLANKDDKWGIVDYYGRCIIDPVFDAIDYDKNGQVFIVNKGDKYGMYNLAGEMILPPGLDAIENFEDGKAAVWMSYETGYVDTKGFISDSLLEKVFTKAAILDKSGVDTEALPLYKQILTVNPAYAMAHNNIGIMMIEQESFKEGMDRLKIANLMDPNSKEISENLKQAKKDRNDRRWNRISAGLETAAAVLLVATATYSAVETIKNGGSASSSLSSLSDGLTSNSASGGMSLSERSSGGNNCAYYQQRISYLNSKLGREGVSSINQKANIRGKTMRNQIRGNAAAGVFSPTDFESVTGSELQASNAQSSYVREIQRELQQIQSEARRAGCN